MNRLERGWLIRVVFRQDLNENTPSQRIQGQVGAGQGTALELVDDLVLAEPQQVASPRVQKPQAELGEEIIDDEPTTELVRIAQFRARALKPFFPHRGLVCLGEQTTALDGVPQLLHGLHDGLRWQETVRAKERYRIPFRNWHV